MQGNEQVSRDMFIFSCYTALFYTDVYHLTAKHIIHESSMNWIRKPRKKTGNICMPHSATARSICRYRALPRYSHKAVQATFDKLGLTDIFAASGQYNCLYIELTDTIVLLIESNELPRPFSFKPNFLYGCIFRSNLAKVGRPPKRNVRTNTAYSGSLDASDKINILPGYRTDDLSI